MNNLFNPVKFRGTIGGEILFESQRTNFINSQDPSIAAIITTVRKKIIYYKLHFYDYYCQNKRNVLFAAVYKVERMQIMETRFAQDNKLDISSRQRK